MTMASCSLTVSHHRHLALEVPSALVVAVRLQSLALDAVH